MVEVVWQWLYTLYVFYTYDIARYKNDQGKETKEEQEVSLCQQEETQEKKVKTSFYNMVCKIALSNCDRTCWDSMVHDLGKVQF